MTDPRIGDYARLIVERCIDVQPGWQVIVQAPAAARPLVEEVSRFVARRGAYALFRIGFETNPWKYEAPEELLERLPPLELYVEERVDARIMIGAPENTRTDADLARERRRALGEAWRPVMERYLGGEAPWLSCAFPTNALAQEAGMSLAEFEDFLYGACLIDWDAAAADMRRIAERLAAAEEVRIVGDGTDLLVGVAGRRAEVEDGRINLPGGEVFCCPVEDSAAGVVTFSEFPAVYGNWGGREIADARLEFEGGVVVSATARSGEDLLLEVLATDDGARRLGELGIGCNPGITRYMANPLFDEKIAGTVHLALGASFPPLGGANASSIHWDLVKDLRSGGGVYFDGELVQENGAWIA